MNTRGQQDEFPLAAERQDVRKERWQRIRPSDKRPGDNRHRPEPLTEAKTTEHKASAQSRRDSLIRKEQRSDFAVETPGHSPAPEGGVPGGPRVPALPWTPSPVASVRTCRTSLNRWTSHQVTGQLSLRACHTEEASRAEET